MTNSLSQVETYTKEQEEAVLLETLESLKRLVVLSREHSLPKLEVGRRSVFMNTLSPFDGHQDHVLCVDRGFLIVEKRWGRWLKTRDWCFADDYGLELDRLVALMFVEYALDKIWEVIKTCDDLVDLQEFAKTQHLVRPIWVQKRQPEGILLTNGGLVFVTHTSSQIPLDPSLITYEGVRDWGLKPEDVAKARMMIEPPKSR